MYQGIDEIDSSEIPFAIFVVFITFLSSLLFEVGFILCLRYNKMFIIGQYTYQWARKGKY